VSTFTERATKPEDAPRQSWRPQALLALVMYGGYVLIRDWNGRRAGGDQGIARAHGLQVLHAERRLGLDVELGWQTWALQHRTLLTAMNVFYGTFHFVGTAAVFVLLLRRAPVDVFRRARTVLAVATGISLIAFLLYPTMPPRLLPPSYGYQDTLETVGGLWSYNHGVVERISDPFAAMPSLHIVWAAWCAWALGTLLRNRCTRLLCAGYPLLTALTVLATGTHWLLDLAAGLAVLAGAWLITDLRFSPARGHGT
jgi:hypothetical protein